jgi:hypothetical protein
MQPRRMAWSWPGKRRHAVDRIVWSCRWVCLVDHEEDPWWDYQDMHLCQGCGELTETESALLVDEPTCANCDVIREGA